MSEASPAPIRPNPLNRIIAGDPQAFAVAVLLDIGVLALAFAGGLLLRFDGDVPRNNAVFVAQVFPLIALGYVCANIAVGVYRTIWAYGSIADVLNLFRAVVTVTGVLFLGSLILQERQLPLSSILIAGALAFPLMAVVKMRTRVIASLPWAPTPSRRLLIIGAGRNGQLLARELQNDPGLNYQPVGYVDNDRRMLHQRIHGLKVLGGDDDLERIIVERDVDAVAIALPNAPGSAIRRIVAVCQKLNIPVRMVPAIGSWAAGKGSQDTFRDVTLEDLLGREPVEIDYEACSHSVRDRVVLVTGAAGSIGSELCRQVLSFHPRELHILDNNETGLHDLVLELSREAHETIITPWIADVADETKIDGIFNRVRPQLLYHAAAYKHVPMMEAHPDEAFRVNVLGTLNVVQASRTYETGTFVLISTDKAVRPTSTMGATKRIAELLVLAFAGHEPTTTYVAVRFGNVMGSRGSVVPTFMRQIERGGPVTVMDPGMMRYFISIPEAVSLVIQAGTFGGDGNIYMLDMGEEISILELAERMIRLRGLRPGHDIEVVFTGSRPGEKLREELVADFETLETTAHPKVMRLSAPATAQEAEVRRLIAELSTVMRDDSDELKRRIHLVARRYDTTQPADQPSPAESSAPIS